MRLFLRIAAFIIIAAGAFMVYTARFIVSKFALDANVSCDFEDEMTEEELKDFKFKKAVTNMKMYGMLVVLPGLIMVFRLF